MISRWNWTYSFKFLEMSGKELWSLNTEGNTVHRLNDATSSSYFRRLALNNQCLWSQYENIPIQIYSKFHLQKLIISDKKNKTDIFYISSQNIDCVYSLEPPRRGGSNEYTQSMFLSRNKKNNVYPCKPQFYCIKVGFYVGMFSW